MEVTNQNLAQLLPIFEKAVEESEFIAIDTEFTGLNREATSCVLDTPHERYGLLRACSKYSIVQYGICTFSWDQEVERYISKPFNFYIFKRPMGRSDERISFECQNSSMDFLAKQGFDFNKWIKQGLSYMYPTDEERARCRLQKTSDDGRPTAPRSEKKKTPTTPVPPSQRKYVEGVCSQVNDLLEKKDEKFILLSPSSGFNRRLVYEAIERRFPETILGETVENEKKIKVMKLSKVTAQEKKDFQDGKEAAELDAFELHVGFSKIIQILSKSGKLLVGHNMMLDLLMTINQFFTPLPMYLDDLKQVVSTVFPKLMDTKLLASTAPVKDHMQSTVLTDVKQRSSEAPFIRPDICFADGFTTYKDGQGRLHEAAYDAHLTGYSFIRMATYLCSLQNEASKIDHEHPVLQPFLNRIFMMRIQDMQYWTLDGLDNVPLRNHVFHVSFPREWKTENISNLFSDYGYVYITWLSDTSAFASLAKESNADQVVRDLVCGPSNGIYRVTPYAEFKELTGAGSSSNGKDSHRLRRKRLLSDDGEKIKAKKQVISDELEEGELPSDDDSVNNEASKLASDQNDSTSVYVPGPLFDVPIHW